MKLTNKELADLLRQTAALLPAGADYPRTYAECRHALEQLENEKLAVLEEKLLKTIHCLPSYAELEQLDFSDRASLIMKVAGEFI